MKSNVFIPYYELKITECEHCYGAKMPVFNQSIVFMVFIRVLLKINKLNAIDIVKISRHGTYLIKSDGNLCISITKSESLSMETYFTNNTSQKNE